RARGGWPDNAKGLNHYADYLRDLATKEEIWHQEGLTELGAGWAIGTTAWRQAVAKDNAHQSLADGLSPAARADLRQARRQQCLEQHLRALNKTPADLQTRPFNQPWKLKLAQQVREECGASITWLAETIQLGKPGSLRGYLHRLKINNN
ncbi:MAG: transposase, partial [Opitutaceae bacterium]|nr:transposase [Opitutaceae bacterium]